MTDSLLAPENDYRSLLGREVHSPRLRVAVVIPVFNRTGLLQRTIAGLTRQSYPANLISVHVADDGSTEDVVAAVSEVRQGLDVTVVRREHEGYGAGQARNLGAVSADDADVLVFFDADCIPDPAAVERHAVWHHMADNLVVIGSRHHVDTSALSPAQILEGDSLRALAFGTEDPPDSAWVSQDHRAVLHRRTASLRHGDVAFRSLVSSNFSLRRDRFMAVGGFSEDFTRWGGEDTELGWRLWNDGSFFVDEPTAAIYHQLQEDEGGAGWREQSRAANDGLIQSKIPHRHYRRSSSGVINESPKVSVLVTNPDPGRIDELTEQIFGQRLDDVEIVITGQTGRLTTFMERRAADPRISSAADIEEGVRRSRGEFLAIAHGAAGLDHRLLSRSVSALEGRPNIGWVRSAYGIPTREGLDVYRRATDTARIDRAWDGELPLFAMTRRRELMKCLIAGLTAAEAWAWVSSNLESAAHGTPLVVVPAEDPGHEHQSSVRPPTSLRSMLLDDLKNGGRAALTAPVRAARSLVTGLPYRQSPVEPARPRPVSGDRPATIRYVGWTGRSNLGDEAMLQAVRGLLTGVDLTTSGDRADLLMLGGGTLINRGYLRHLRPLDSPRIERVAFGTGVANPDYWGDPKESPSDWIEFLESCLYVGVRGPVSASLLEGWGLRRDVEIVGDPALALTAPDTITKVEGRVVVCPAWARGLLWGESDDDVITAFAALVSALRRDGHDVWALSAFPGDDSHIIDMMRRADAPDLPYLAAHDDPGPALELLASAELVVSERLHGAVLAAAAGTVPVLVEYRPKLRDFAESIGMRELVIRTDVMGGLEEMARDAYSRRSELGDIVAGRVANYRERQERAARIIIEALEG